MWVQFCVQKGCKEVPDLMLWLLFVWIKACLWIYKHVVSIYNRRKNLRAFDIQLCSIETRVQVKQQVCPQITTSGHEIRTHNMQLNDIRKLKSQTQIKRLFAKKSILPSNVPVCCQNVVNYSKFMQILTWSVDDTGTWAKSEAQNYSQN